MNIIHLVPSVGIQSGGLGPIALGLAEGQKALGHTPSIWCLGSNKQKQATLPHRYTENLLMSPVWGPASLGYSPIAERMAVSAKAKQYHILHQHSIWMATSRVTNQWRKLGHPTIVAPQGALDKYPLKQSYWKKRLALVAYEAENLRSAACLQATSSAEVTNFREFGLNNPIAVIPNGVSAEWFDSSGSAANFYRDYSLPTDKRLLLFLSRIHPKKGLPLLFEALAHIKQDLTDWLVVIAGPDELNHRHELELLAEKLKIANLIRFVGPLSGNPKRDAFAAADLFVLPTYSEGAPVAVLEALSCGVPVLTTKGAPWEELVTNRCGWWVDIDSDAICQALLDALHSSKRELEEMGKRGRNLIGSRYTWLSIAQQTIRLYEWLLGDSEMPDFVELSNKHAERYSAIKYPGVHLQK